MIELTGPILKENRNPFRKFPVSSLLAILTAAVFFLQLSEQGTENFSLSLITSSLQVAFVASIAAYFICRPAELTEPVCHAVSFLAAVVFFALGWIVVPYSLYMLVVGGFAGAIIAISPIFYKATQDEVWKHVVWAAIAAVIGICVFIFWCSAFSTIQWMAKTLFPIETRFKQMTEIVTALGIILGLLFFLAWLPPSKPVEENQINAGLLSSLRSVFDFLLVPLIFIVALILHVYVAWILLGQTFPDGQVGKIITAYVAIVLVVRFIIHPFLPEGHVWTRTFGRIWALLLIAPIILLLVAVTMRSSQYGMTINRYYLYAGSAAALLIIFAQILKRWRNDIRVIAVVPAFCLIVSVFGPWSVQNWVGISQAQYINHKYVNNGRLGFSHIRLFDKDYNDVMQHIYLLDETDQLSRLLPYIQKSNENAIAYITAKNHKYATRPSEQEFMQALGVQPIITAIGEDGVPSSPRDTLVFSDQYVNRGLAVATEGLDVVIPYIYITRSPMEGDLGSRQYVNARFEGDRLVLRYKGVVDNVSLTELAALASASMGRNFGTRTVDLRTQGNRRIRIVPLEVILDAKGSVQSISLSLMLKDREWSR